MTKGMNKMNMRHQTTSRRRVPNGSRLRFNVGRLTSHRRRRTPGRRFVLAVLTGTVVVSGCSREESIATVEAKLVDAWSRNRSFVADVVVRNYIKQELFLQDTVYTSVYERLNEGGRVMIRQVGRTTGIQQHAGEQVSQVNYENKLIADGTNAFTIHDNTIGERIVTQLPQAEHSVDGLGGGDLFNRLHRQYDLTLRPPETLDDRPVIVIEGKTKSDAVGPIRETVTYYFDRTSGCAVKVVTTSDDGTIKSTTTVSNIRLDRPLSPEQFTFVPDKDTLVPRPPDSPESPERQKESDLLMPDSKPDDAPPVENSDRSP